MIGGHQIGGAQIGGAGGASGELVGITEGITLNAGTVASLSVPVAMALELGAAYGVTEALSIRETIGLRVVFSAPQKYLAALTFGLSLDARYAATAAAYAELLAGLELGDTLEDAQRTLIDLAEGLELHDANAPALKLYMGAVYGLALSDTYRAGLGADVTDGVVLGDALAMNVRYWLGILESLDLGMTPENAVALYAEVEEGMELDGTPEANLRLFAAVEDGLILHFGILLEGDYYYGHVTNAEGANPESDYTAWTFNSLFNVGSRYFGVKDDGVYELTGDDDDGTAIEMDLMTGLVDIGEGYLSRIDDAQIGYASGGGLYLGVRVVNQGVMQQHWYELESVTADAPREGVVPVGKGLRSLYWQFRIKNVAGADLQVDALRLFPIRLSRRRNA